MTSEVTDILKDLALWAAPFLITVVGWFVLRLISSSEERSSSLEGQISKVNKELATLITANETKLSAYVEAIRKESASMSRQNMEFHKDVRAIIRDSQAMVDSLRKEYEDSKTMTKYIEDLHRQLEDVTTRFLRDVSEIRGIKDSFDLALVGVQAVKTDAEAAAIATGKTTQEVKGKIIVIEKLIQTHNAVLKNHQALLKKLKE